ncbi:MAG: hypothetical protein A3F92_10975 [Candidatus Rokubacteria bacterium RIFCSPLOWO2_12_FULL_71_22]|nr:MAG: hypothetical protein A3F92_10975 [Candidatus Rokubacteria bacterium RIFCSPLOWO2_12_FULL_71_22]
MGVGAVVATVATLPHRAVSCVIGDVIGFFVGSALRVPLAPAAAAGLRGSEGLDRLGQNVVQVACTDDLVVTAEHFREWRPAAGSAGSPVPEAR